MIHSSTTASLLLLLALTGTTTVYGQFQDPEIPESASVATTTPTELDISEPSLWQMAAFAARSMSTKSRRFKLATLTAAEQIDSLYRLKVTLKQVSQDTPIDKNDLLYCTVEVRSNGQSNGQQQQNWEVENFGCTAPAIVRRRRPAKKVAPTPAPAPVQSEVVTTYEQPQPQPQQPAFPQTSSLDSATAYKYLAPVDNSIALDNNGLDDLPPKRQYKRQTLFSRHSNYFPQYVQYNPQPQTVRYLPLPQYQRPMMGYNYQAYY